MSRKPSFSWTTPVGPLVIHLSLTNLGAGIEPTSRNVAGADGKRGSSSTEGACEKCDVRAGVASSNLGLPDDIGAAPRRTATADLGWFSALWDTSDFPPRWRCGTWTRLLGWTHILADLCIWGAYTSIPLILIYYVRKRRDVPFPRVFWLFALFILSCGVGHLVEAGIFWWPAYRVSALVKVVTAIVSVGTVFALAPIVPKALTFPRLEKINDDLRRELQRRRQAEERFQMAVEAAPNAMVMVDAAGTILLVNSRMEQLFGYAPKELPGRNVDALLPHALREAHATHRAAFMERPEPRPMGQGRDLYGLRKDGREIPVEIGLNPIHTDAGTFVLAAVIDITERKHYERELTRHAQQLQKHNEELSRRNAELDEFTYVASHDLQEPLRKLTSFSKLLPLDLGGDLSESAAKDLDFITDAAERMQRLVQDLLTLSRAGRAEIRRERVSLDDCVGDALELLAKRVEESGASIERDALPEVMGDRTMLTQLFQNLLGNALKFVRPGQRPEIHVTAERAAEGAEWIIGVRDRGIGIKPEYLDCIFTPFKRLHGRTEYPGSGIGLAICRKAVERHGGRLWVESQPGRGSHFRFTLKPFKKADSWDEEMANPPSSCSWRMTRETRN